MSTYGTDQPLGHPVRQIVSLEQNAAKAAFADFLSLGTLSADQITFIGQVIDHLVDNGTMEPESHFAPPFTDLHDEGVVGVLPEFATQIVEAIKQINSNAVAA